ncbi:MAG: hypothetical protein KDE09_10635 [Anaerolineales bacterium]|nr:hypothetical protein [Anaerolineales bacterium]MCB1218905.1 hypothetical protein [bacterium]
MKPDAFVLLATLLISGCGNTVTTGQYVDYSVPVVKDFKAFDEPLAPGQTTVVRYRIGYEKISIHIDEAVAENYRLLATSVSEGELVPLPVAVGTEKSHPSFEEVREQWEALNFSEGFSDDHPAYNAPYLYFLYKAPAREQNVRIELNLGHDGGPGGRGHSDNILVQWPYD